MTLWILAKVSEPGKKMGSSVPIAKYGGRNDRPFASGMTKARTIAVQGPHVTTPQKNPITTHCALLVFARVFNVKRETAKSWEQ